MSPGTHASPTRWDPHTGDRTGPAWDRIVDLLRDGEWHQWSDVVDAVVSDSGLKPKTVSNLVHAGIKNKALHRRGQYSRNSTNDQRAIKLTDRGADR